MPSSLSSAASAAASAPALPRVRRTGEATLPTPYGRFDVRTYAETDAAGKTGTEHIVLSMGRLDGADADGADDAPLVRLHSECATGDLFGSLRCDCGPQLALAQSRIAARGRGAIVYLRDHEGRGIGLAAKLAAYQLQDRGLDTVDANRALGRPVDARRYDTAAAILLALGVRRLHLLSNNPLKVRALVEAGIDVVARSAHEVPAQDHNRNYLQTKRDRLGHWLALDDDA